MLKTKKTSQLPDLPPSYWCFTPAYRLIDRINKEKKIDCEKEFGEVIRVGVRAENFHFYFYKPDRITEIIETDAARLKGAKLFLSKKPRLFIRVYRGRSKAKKILEQLACCQSS